MTDVIEKTDTTPAAEGSEATPKAEGSETAQEIASYKKRQAGAEAARQIAEGKYAEAEKELAKLRSANQTAAEKDLTELARQTARAEAAEKTAAEAEAKAAAKILDYRFPKARAKLPGVTDEATLAEIETLYGDEAEPPTPTAHNEGRSTASKGTPAKPETAAEIRTRLEATPLPEGW